MSYIRHVIDTWKCDGLNCTEQATNEHMVPYRGAVYEVDLAPKFGWSCLFTGNWTHKHYCEKCTKNRDVLVSILDPVNG